jgi:sulfatase modifying factor 1
VGQCISGLKGFGVDLATLGVDTEGKCLYPVFQSEAGRERRESMRRKNMGSTFAVPGALFMILILGSAPGHALEPRIQNDLGMEFVLIQAGTFLMGSPQDEPNRNADEVQHDVSISKPFYIQSTEVTLGQWWAVMGKRMFGARKGPENGPVTSVSWFDTQEFIEKLNRRGEARYRLPTEAEWEFACRAGAMTAYAWGNTFDCTKAMYANNPVKSEECLPFAQSRGLPVGGPAPVKSYPPNRWGIYDMHGNVWEWCRDWYAPYEAKNAADPGGPGSGEFRVRRGGSWYRFGYYCRSANRNFGHPAARYQTTGFRLVREAR